MKWVKCSDRLPEEDQFCWVCTKDKEVIDLYFNKTMDRYEWTPIRYVKTVEPGFRDDGYNREWFLDEILYWMPYFTPQPPDDFYYEDPFKDWICCEERLPEFNQPCKFLIHGYILTGRHGKDGMFAGDYVNESGEACRNCTYNRVSHWKPIDR